MPLHETHVCRDCGAEITIPYARPAAGSRCQRQPTVELLRRPCPEVWPRHPERWCDGCAEGWMTDTNMEGRP